MIDEDGVELPGESFWIILRGVCVLSCSVRLLGLSSMFLSFVMF